jgi:hypothetical protein
MNTASKLFSENAIRLIGLADSTPAGWSARVVRRSEEREARSKKKSVEA